jgi:hypothetical protein
MNAGARRSVIVNLLPISVLICVHLWLFSGCASETKKPTTQPTSMSQRQDAALRDPFGYKPDTSRDISGGDIGHLDRDGLKRDLNNVFNP